MKTMYLSRTELEIISQYWDLYVKKNHPEQGVIVDPPLDWQMDRILEGASEETRDAFVSALQDFELQGEEFQVRIAPDDANLVSHNSA